MEENKITIYLRKNEKASNYLKGNRQGTEKNRKVIIYPEADETVESIYPRGLKEVFLLNADRFSTCTREKVIENVPEGTHLHGVIGGLSVLHLLQLIKPNEVTFIDINPVQVSFCRAFIELIKTSDSYLDLWKRYYCRDFGNDIMNLPITVPDKKWKISKEFSKEVPKIAESLKFAEPSDDLPKNYKVNNKTTHDYKYTYGNIKCLKLKHNGLYPWHSVTTNPKYPTCGVHHIFHGHGFHCEEGFQWTKKWLLTHKSNFINDSVFALEYPDNTFLYMTNVWALFRKLYILFLEKNKHRIDKNLWVRGDSHRVTIRKGEISWTP